MERLCKLMQIPVFFSLLVIFLLWFTFKIKKNGKQGEELSDQFWRQETKANLTRKKDISNLNFISVPVNELPFEETSDPTLKRIQDKVMRMSEKKMVNFSGITNTALKLEYGTANIDALSAYDENYTTLIRTLTDWSNYLYEHDKVAEAKQILEFCIECGTDITNNYLLLAKIYQNENQSSRINDLIESADKINSFVKDSIIEKLNAMIE